MMAEPKTYKQTKAQSEVVPGLGAGTNVKPNKEVKDASGKVIGYTYGDYAQNQESGAATEEITEEKKAAEKAEKEKLGKGTPMPKQSDYGGDMGQWGTAMRKWREENRTAKDAAGAVASRPK